MVSTAESVCPLDCPDTCSLSVTIEDGRVVAVDGSHRNPLTDGFICAKVRRDPARIYSPLRVLHPQRRVGVKGEGRFNLPNPRLTMHPDDAAARGLRDGQPVRVVNALGEVHVPLRVARTVRPGVVTLPKGLWRHSTLNGATSTALVPDDYTDIGDGACFNDARVEVEAL